MAAATGHIVVVKKSSDFGALFYYNHHVGAKLKAKTNFAAILFSEHKYGKR